MIEPKDGWKVFVCIAVAIILSVFVISPQRKMDKAWEARRLVREESTLVCIKILTKAICKPNPFYIISRLDYWTLTFEDGAKITIKESPYWFVPIGEKVEVYKYVDESRRGGKLYFIKRKIDREKKEVTIGNEVFKTSRN